MDETKLHKLPKWAQSEIVSLTCEIAELSSALARFQGEEGSPLTIRFPFKMSHTPIPNGSIRFALNNGDWIDIRIDGDHLEVNSPFTLHIIPQATNHVHIGSH